MMSCNQINYLTQVAPADATPANTPSGPTGLWGPRLFVSNCPETIPALSNLKDGNGNLTHTLMKATVPAFTAPTVRVFAWHLNESGGDLQFQLLLSLSAFFGTVISYKRQLAISNGPLPVAGLCLSKAQMYGTLDQIPIASPGLSTNESALYNHTVPNGHLFAIVAEFSLLVVGQANLQIRSAVSSSPTIGGSFAEEPALPDSHVRGCWGYSEASFYGFRYDVKPLLHANPQYLSVCENAGPEHSNSAFGTGAG